MNAPHNGRKRPAPASYRGRMWLVAMLLANYLIVFSIYVDSPTVASILRLAGLAIFILAVPGVLMAVVRLFWRSPPPR